MTPTCLLVKRWRGMEWTRKRHKRASLKISGAWTHKDRTHCKIPSTAVLCR
jgi:hypothetical protein